ncbi:MAG: protein phosphatase 2C domain-containing protein [Bacillota bacterium]|nr:protein phosphatase 2C domain-containing protein [Bacillota bacterium]
MAERFFVTSAYSDTGNFKSVNQDCIITRTGKLGQSVYGLFAVADGMGGLSYGEVASQIASKVLNSWWDVNLYNLLNNSGKSLLNDLEKSICALFYDINDCVRDYSKREGVRIGTTLSLIFIYNSDFFINHVGDSRIYRINKSVTQLTTDHTWVADQVLSGYLTKEEARLHPNRNILTQCVGVYEKPEIYSLRGVLEAGDLFFICSDGFYDKLNEYDFLFAAMNFVKSVNKSNDSFAKDLIEDVKMIGEKDNISLIIVFPKVEGLKDFLLKKLRKII